MKKIFLALMAVAAIALTGCDPSEKEPKSGVKSDAEIKIAAAKDALGTDGAAFFTAIEKVGFEKEQGSGIYKKGNESCHIAIKNNLIAGIVFETNAAYADFDTIRNYFLENERAYGIVIPDNFSGKYIIDGCSAIFGPDSEASFADDMELNVKAESFTNSDHKCVGESMVLKDNIPFAKRSLYLFRASEDQWVCLSQIELIGVVD